MDRTLLYSILFSLVIHLAALLLAIWIHIGPGRQDWVEQPELTQALEMAWEATPPDRQPLPEPEPESIEPESLPLPEIVEPEPQAPDDYAVLLPDSIPVIAITDSMWDTLTHEKLYMIDTVYLARSDYIPIPDSLKKPIAESGKRVFVMDEKGMLRPINLPPPPTELNIPRALFKGAEKLGELLAGDKGPPRLDFVPTRAEIEALSLIWDEGQITDQSIYAKMDTSIKLSAEDMNKVLDSLTERGLLKRKIVSPQYKVMLFITEVEVSPKNIRNRIYEYEPLVTRGEMQRFLNALYYQVKTGQADGFSEKDRKLLTGEHVKSLLDQLYIHHQDKE